MAQPERTYSVLWSSGEYSSVASKWQYSTAFSIPSVRKVCRYCSAYRSTARSSPPQPGRHSSMTITNSTSNALRFINKLLSRSASFPTTIVLRRFYPDNRRLVEFYPSTIYRRRFGKKVSLFRKLFAGNFDCYARISDSRQQSCNACTTCRTLSVRYLFLWCAR